MSNTLTLKDVAEHSSRKSLYLIVHGKVYDVTKFISKLVTNTLVYLAFVSDQHPGGEEVLLDESGKDSTVAFEDIGHSEDAREILKTFYVGDLNCDPSELITKPLAKPPTISRVSPELHKKILRIILSVVVVGWLAYRFFV